jgi:hypothetical protein
MGLGLICLLESLFCNFLAILTLLSAVYTTFFTKNLQKIPKKILDASLDIFVDSW